MRRATLVVLLLAAPTLAAAEPLSGSVAEDATRQSANAVLKKVVPKYGNDSPAARAWRDGESDAKQHALLYSSTGEASVDGTRVNGAFSTTRTYKSSEYAGKVVRQRSIDWDWKSGRGKLRVDGTQQTHGIKVTPTSVLEAVRKDDGSERSATLTQKETFTVDQATHDVLHPRLGALQRLFARGTAGPLVSTLPKEARRALVAGAQIEIESRYSRTSTQSLPALAKDRRPPNQIARERKYTLKVGGSEHTLSEAGYRALKTHFRR